MYKKGIYKGFSKKEIREKVDKKGFDPLTINDPPSRIYFPHTHPETKLLAILDGSMEVKTGGNKYTLEKGDELIIPGNQKHEAVVGNDGCTFFWSEKLI